jgi:hypothetical protein
MDKLETYKNLIRQITLRYVDLFRDEANSDVQEIAICDDEQGHYQWLSVGWENGKRAFYIQLYVRLHDGKIWIEKDTTEEGIANMLVSEGVPHSDIVLAFHSPKMREFTDFAAA